MSLIQCDHVAVVDESHSFVVPWCCQGMEQEGRGESWGSGAVYERASLAATEEVELLFSLFLSRRQRRRA